MTDDTPSDPDSSLRCNSAGLALIAKYEGFSSAPYQDSGGIWTQGFGHTAGVTAGSAFVTRATAMKWLADDIATAEEAVNRFVRYELTSNQFSALVSFCYNIGQGNFAKSTALSYLNSGDFEDVPNAMKLWCKDHAGNVQQGLLDRRNAEIALFNLPDTMPADSSIIGAV